MVGELKTSLMRKMSEGRLWREGERTGTTVLNPLIPLIYGTHRPKLACVIPSTIWLKRLRHPPLHDHSSVERRWMMGSWYLALASPRLCACTPLLPRSRTKTENTHPCQHLRKHGNSSWFFWVLRESSPSMRVMREFSWTALTSSEFVSCLRTATFLLHQTLLMRVQLLLWTEWPTLKEVEVGVMILRSRTGGSGKKSCTQLLLLWSTRPPLTSPYPVFIFVG